ncbi:Ribosome biogenesis protein BMS1 like protein [Trachymyrmex septentrionalis]|uniref:Ribosome biogenesis protein BMS1 like protein n=1 Tax=Trachymyrmex septentrionalis TaxID=34720 RepID=A0A195EX77_9HYME|nr:Ribosome biogenesis protein BMS1 like protein [Trachymyrmex septentrionalis]
MVSFLKKIILDLRFWLLKVERCIDGSRIYEYNIIIEIIIFVQFCDTSVKIAAGFLHTLVLTDKGKVYGWGTNTHGQLNFNENEVEQLISPCKKRARREEGASMSFTMDDTVKHKSHRDRNAGRKAEKKKTKKEHVQELSDKQRNPKAFTFNSAIRAERRFRRKQDIETKKQHIPLIDRTPLEPPPVLVAVVGPPKVGKSLVIQCLIKSYVKQPLTNILGPVTVVSGKKQRITFIECNNDVNCMIDIAKVADLVLLLVDASFGFEMEIFEFLNICQVHGMPRIMGVLTHLDLIKNARQMRKTKKTLKHRFWAEVFAGAKLFYLSGLLHEEYLRTEIKNLARFISVMRFRPLTWRTTHSYLLADRLEDLTSPELIRKNPKVDRNICLYGYVRGIPLNKDTSIHIPGCGDMKIKDVNFLPDPCPLPEHIKKRALVEKERLIYAPFSGVGGIVYDKDAVYVELGGSHSYKEEDTGLAGALMDTQETLDQKLQHSELKLFSDAAPIKSQDVNEKMDDADRLSDFEDIAFEEEEDEEEKKEDIKIDESKEVPDELKWKRNLTEKAREAFINRQQSNKNLMKIVYGVFDKSNMIKEEENKEDEKLDQDIGGIFHVIQEQQRQKIQQRELQNQEESVFFSMESPRDWLKEENKALLINRFVTGKWKESEDAEELLKLDDEDLYGDFEDLETGEKHKEEHPEELPDEMEEKKKLLEKKKKLKEQFNAEYDNTEKKTYYDELKDEVERQAGINKSEFEGLDDDIRVQLEGYRPGMYIRVEIESVPCELITHLDPTYPIIIGGLLHGEENIGYVQTRIKKHRWYSRILKSRDPLIFSIGWRRFQSLPIYSKLEDNLRHRMLKYTPEHVACMGHLWGPITPQGTGILAVQDVASKEPGFRIVATGSIVELDKSTEVMKKLKLIGVPMKIHRKTAFIKDMFNSALEVAKFEGARIKTVSGIRGQIKKAISKPEGCFRATFEDKIMLSDIVFCRTWYKVDVPRFYNPVTSLLLPPAEKNRWHGMKTTGQLKRERNIHAEANMNSIYTPIERDVKVFKPLFIPRKLQKELPYRDKPKLESVPHLRKPKFKQGRVAVVREPQEQNIARIIKMIRTNYAKKQKQSKEAMTKRITAYQAQIKEEEAKKLTKQKQMKKEIFRDLSKLEKKTSR